ncbi:ciliary microtubule inner protein 4-like isoform X2 [Chiloscyllium punctatum]
MDPECPQFQVSETAAITDQLTKPKTLNTGGQRYPGRSLFGTTLDSKGFYKGLSEEEQKVATVPSDAQPHNQLEQHKYKPESVNIPKSKNCLDLLRTTSPKSRNTNDIKQDVRDDSSEPKRSLKTSLAGRITGRQIDRERSVPCTPSAMTDGTQSPLCVALQQPPSPEVECIIPQNIKHKFRTHVVDELLADDEVKEFLREKEMPAKSSDSEVPSVQPQEQRSDEISWYEKIGYPLRCNIFPGFSGKWQSEVQSTYTKEVHHRFKRSPDHWHGRTTDHLGHWVEMNIIHQKLKKALGELEKHSEN